MRFAIDLEHPDKPPPHPAAEELRLEILLVEIVERCLVMDLGSWTSDGSDLQWRDFLSENQTVGMLFFLVLFFFFFWLLLFDESSIVDVISLSSSEIFGSDTIININKIGK